MPFHITYLRRTDQDHTEEIQRQYLRGNKIGIGQGTGCDIVIEDVRVSLLHATIEKVDTGYLLKDMTGANGTYVNGKVIQTHLLATYDTMQIGSSVFLVCASSPAEPLALQVQHPQPEPLAGAEAPVAYRKNLRLSSGFLTKRWLTILSLLAVMGITAIAWPFRTLLAPGAVSQKHSVIEHACAQCHRTTGQPVADTTCKTCHDGPQHHLNQAFTPSCVTCHTEHRGRQAALAVVEDRLCTQCHAALQARGVEHSASLRVVGPDGLAIPRFTSGHPEFAVQVGSERIRLSNQTHLRDATQMQLNHMKHLQPNLSRPD